MWSDCPKRKGWICSLKDLAVNREPLSYPLIWAKVVPLPVLDRPNGLSHGLPDAKALCLAIILSYANINALSDLSICVSVSRKNGDGEPVTAWRGMHATLRRSCEWKRGKNLNLFPDSCCWTMKVLGLRENSPWKEVDSSVWDDPSPIPSAMECHEKQSLLTIILHSNSLRNAKPQWQRDECGSI